MPTAPPPIDSVTNAQRDLIELLAAEGAFPSKSALARRLGWSLAKAFDVIRRLETRDVVRSVRDSRNRRTTPIDLTESGGVLAERLVQRPRGAHRKGTARRTLREDYFAQGLTPTNGYDFGFLLADGSMNRPRNAVHIQLAASDRGELEKMRLRYGSDAPIAWRRKQIRGKTYASVTIHFASRRLCDDLFALGIGPNKDFQDYDLPRVTGATAAAVMRGLFDGDGTVVMVRTQNPPGARIAINNREHTLEWVKDTVDRETGVIGHIYRQRPRHFVYSVMAHEDVVRLAEWMYSVPGPYLARKHDKLFALIKQHEVGLIARRAVFDDRDRQVAELYGRGVEMPEIAVRTGLTLGTVARHRKRIGMHHRKQYKTPTWADLCEVRRRREQGETNAEMAIAMEFSESTIQKLAANPRILFKLRAEWEIVQFARNARSSGQLIKSVAKEVGRSPDGLVALLRRYDGLLSIENPSDLVE